MFATVRRKMELASERDCKSAIELWLLELATISIISRIMSNGKTLGRHDISHRDS